MGDLSQEELDALAAQLGGIADDLELSASEDEAEDARMNATLRALRSDELAAAHPAPAGDQLGASAAVPLGPRARNAQKAREAKALKKAQGIGQAAHASGSIAPAASARPVAAQQLLALQMPAHAVVPSALLHCISTGVMAPFIGPHLQGAVGHALRLHHTQGLAIDSQIAKIVDFMCRTSEGAAMTKKSLMEELGETQQSLDALLPAIANTVTIVDHALRRKHEKHFRSLAKPLLYVDACRYDETPMQMSTQHREQVVLKRKDDKVKGSTALAPRLPAVRSLHLGTDVGVCKLLQTENKFGLLGSYENPNGEGQIFVCIKGAVSTYIQDLENGTGATYARALQNSMCPAQEACGFRMPLRMVCTDKGSANFVAERIVQAARGPEWSSLAFTCDMHTAAGCHTKTSLLVQDDISALLN